MEAKRERDTERGGEEREICQRLELAGKLLAFRILSVKQQKEKMWIINAAVMKFCKLKDRKSQLNDCFQLPFSKNITDD